MADPMAALVHRVLRQIQVGMPREAVVMAASVRSGRMPSDLERLIQRAEAELVRTTLRATPYHPQPRTTHHTVQRTEAAEAQ